MVSLFWGDRTRPGGTEGSLLALWSAITCGGAQGTTWGARDQTRSVSCKVCALPIPSSRPWMLMFCCFSLLCLISVGLFSIKRQLNC